MMIKYPIHKVAKDFKRGGKEIPSKEIMEILTNHGHPPKNHMQPLNDVELSIVFDYLTQNNQIDSIESVYADVYHEPKAEPEKPAPKGGGKKSAPKQQPDAPKGPAAPPKGEKPKEAAAPSPSPAAALSEISTTVTVWPEALTVVVDAVPSGPVISTSFEPSGCTVSAVFITVSCSTGAGEFSAGREVPCAPPLPLGRSFGVSHFGGGSGVCWPSSGVSVTRTVSASGV